MVPKIVSKHALLLKVSIRVDFIETFSPMIKLATIRVVLTITLTHNWGIRLLDVRNVFLHAQLAEPVFMEQPPALKTHFNSTMFVN